MYRNNRSYKVYSERPADLFHFHSSVADGGVLFATHHGGGLRCLSTDAPHTTVERHGGDTAPKRRAPHPVCVHPGRSYLSFRVHGVLRLTLVSAIEWKAGCISIFFPSLLLYRRIFLRHRDIDILFLLFINKNHFHTFPHGITILSSLSQADCGTFTQNLNEKLRVVEISSVTAELNSLFSNFIPQLRN